MQCPFWNEQKGEKDIQCPYCMYNPRYEQEKKFLRIMKELMREYLMSKKQVRVCEEKRR